MPKAEKSEGVTWQNVVDIRDWPERDTGDNETEEQNSPKAQSNMQGREKRWKEKAIFQKASSEKR